MRTVTFYPTPYGAMRATHTYEASLESILEGRDVETTQMCMLNHVKDYDIIRIVSAADGVIEITNNHDGTYSCDRTSRQLRAGNNLFKLWENGEFDV